MQAVPQKSVVCIVNNGDTHTFDGIKREVMLTLICDVFVVLNSGGVNHIAHLSGALAGVLLIWLLSYLPGGGNTEK